MQSLLSFFLTKSENYCQVPQISGREGQGGGRGGGGEAVGAVKPTFSKVRPNKPLIFMENMF